MATKNTYIQKRKNVEGYGADNGYQKSKILLHWIIKYKKIYCFIVSVHFLSFLCGYEVCVWRSIRLKRKKNKGEQNISAGKVGERLVHLKGLSAHQARWDSSVIIHALPAHFLLGVEKHNQSRQRTDKRGIKLLHHGVAPGWSQFIHKTQTTVTCRRPSTLLKPTV